jgi:M6 family metalloprotease-like protein
MIDMKKTCRFARLMFPVLLLACFSGIANAAPYGPNGREINWVQPGGQKLKLRVFGDDYYARTETQDGHTVVYNPKDKAYHYAELNENRTALKPSGVKAHLPHPNPKLKSLDLPKDGIRRVYQNNLERFAGESLIKWNQRVKAKRLAKAGGPQFANGIQAAPVTGRYVGLTILAQFPNDPQTVGADPIDFPVTRGKMVNYCNKEGYTDDGNTGSIRDFFYDQSNGLCTYVQTVTQVITMPNPRNYYNYANHPTNTLLKDTGIAGRQLITDAIGVLKSQGFDFSSLTVDAGNNAIATNLFFAGQDSGVWAQGLWPHKYNLAAGLNVGTTGNPIFIYNYQATNIENTTPVIGTFCHENGHLLLGYPDLYDIIGEGVGEHCLMGSGNYLDDGKTPSPINAYFKDIVGWGNVTKLAVTEYVKKSLPTTGNVAYQIDNPSVPTEFYIAENRGNGDKWAKYSNDKGIAIWHVDETMDGNILQPHYMVSLMQSDGREDLEQGRNRGDGTDLYDTAASLLTDTTTPNANWWDGSNSKVRIKVLGDPGSKTDVQFGQLPPDTIILASPNGGEVLYRNARFRITWEANIIGGVKIDLYKGGVFNMNIADNLSNTGRYSWNVPLGFKPGEDYTVRISSVSNPKPVSDTSDAVFAISDTTFPENDALPYGWFKPAEAKAAWQFTKSEIYEGTGSLISKPIGDGQIAGIAFRSKFKAGKVSFYYKVSSEIGYDHAAFYIDGVKQLLPTATTKQGISGLGQWVFASFPLPAGKHTLKWTYEKDDSYKSGKDSAWLDGVLLPETKQEIKVENSEGQSLVSNSSEITFPNVRIGEESLSQTLTIKNVGKSDLHGLKIAIKGADPDYFTAGALGKTALKPGKSTTFKLTFKPATPGFKEAKVQILSNDEDESPFSIKVSGKALGIPKITVSQPSDNKLEDDDSTVQFGKERVGQTGKTKTFSVKNIGSAALEGLKVNKSGSAKGDFEVYAIGSIKLAPGESTTFKVTFNPKKQDLRTAKLQVTYDRNKDGPFDVTVKGTGLPKKKASANSKEALIAAVLGGNTEPSSIVTSSSMIGGLKYLTLTYDKAEGIERTVEVSPNLVDWFSGASHTSILTDNESFRTVRDNTPVTPGTKRYIRLKELP